MTINTLLPNYIFLPITSGIPESYLATYLGGVGVFAKLNPNHINGYEFIQASEYAKQVGG